MKTENTPPLHLLLGCQCHILVTLARYVGSTVPLIVGVLGRSILFLVVLMMVITRRRGKR